MSTGDYSRGLWLHAERRRRQSALLQCSRNGQPKYVDASDMYDWAQIVRKQVQRLGQLCRDGVDGEDAWLAQTAARDNDFDLLGGLGSDDTAAAAWVGGFRALLYRTLGYRCQRGGVFNETDAFDVHHRATGVGWNVLQDTHATFTPDALIGYEVTINGAGTFTVTDNGVTNIVLAGFVAEDYPDMGAHPFYFIELKAPAADAVQPVWLDVHIEDWGVPEDASLDHNQSGLGAEVECARREVLIQRVWVQQGTTAEMPTAAYTDASNAKHYVLKIGSIDRTAGSDAVTVSSGSAHDREEYASVAAEVRDARVLQNICVEDEDQPVSLAERLVRDTSVITVSPSVAFRGHYVGAQGLLDALACVARGPRTIFVRNGAYDLTGLGALTVPAGCTLVGESRHGAIIQVDAEVATGPAMDVLTNGRVENLTVLRTGVLPAVTAAVRVGGMQAQISACNIADNLVGSTAVLIASATNTYAEVTRCSVVKYNGTGVRFSISSDEPPADQGNVTPGGGGIGGNGIALPANPNSFGCMLRESTVSVISGTAYSAFRAGIYVGAGDDVQISGCTVDVTGVDGIVVQADLAGSDAPSTWNSRGMALLESTVVRVRPANTLVGTTTSAAVRILSGRVRFRGLHIEHTESTGVLPVYGLYVDTSTPQLVDLEVQGLTLRLANIYAGIRVRESETAATRVVLGDVQITPYAANVGPANGIICGAQGPRADVRVVGGRITESTDTSRSLALYGEASASDVVVDGVGSSLTAPFTSGLVPDLSTAPVSFYAGSTAEHLGAPRFTRCVARRTGGIAFRAHNPDAATTTPLPVVLDACEVVGGRRTVVGFLVSGRAAMVLNNCTGRDTLGRIATPMESSPPGYLAVDGGQFSKEYEPYELTDTPAPWIADAVRARCTVRAEGEAFGFGWGVRIAGGGVADVDVFGLGVGAYVADVIRGVSVTCRAQYCRTALVLSQITGTAHVDLNAQSFYTAAMTASGVQRLRAKLNAESTLPLKSPAVEITDGSAWYVTGRLAVTDSQTCTMVVARSDYGVAEDFTVSGFGMQVTSGESLRLKNVSVDGHVPGFYTSLVLTDISRHVQMDRLEIYGAVVRDCGANSSVLMRDITSHVGGILVQPDKACRGYEFDRVWVRQAQSLAPPADEPTTAVKRSGIYFGDFTAGTYVPTATASSYPYDVVFNDCRVDDWYQVGGDLTLDAPEGRSAGICVRLAGASTRPVLRGCEIAMPSRGVVGAAVGLGVLVGDLNYIANTVGAAGTGSPNNHCRGVARPVVDDCRFRTAYDNPGQDALPRLVVVSRNGYTRVAGNKFESATARNLIFLYGEKDTEDQVVCVPYRGNLNLFAKGSAVLADWTDYARVVASDNYQLDGGMYTTDNADDQAPAVFHTNNVVWDPTAPIQDDGTLTVSPFGAVALLTPLDDSSAEALSQAPTIDGPSILAPLIS